MSSKCVVCEKVCGSVLKLAVSCFAFTSSKSCLFIVLKAFANLILIAGLEMFVVWVLRSFNVPSAVRAWMFAWGIFTFRASSTCRQRCQWRGCCPDTSRCNRYVCAYEKYFTTDAIGMFVLMKNILQFRIVSGTKNYSWEYSRCPSCVSPSAPLSHYLLPVSLFSFLLFSKAIWTKTDIALKSWVLIEPRICLVPVYVQFLNMLKSLCTLFPSSVLYAVILKYGVLRNTNTQSVFCLYWQSKRTEMSSFH